MNEVFELGRLTKDPELKYLPSGSAVSNFEIAVNSKYKSGDEMKEEVSYFHVAVFGRQAENLVEYQSKGNRVLIKGKLKQERWEKDGKKHSQVKIIATGITYLDKSGGNKALQNDGGNQVQEPY